MDGVPIEKIKFIINELHYNIKMKGTMVFIILQTSCKDDMEIFNIVSGVCSIKIFGKKGEDYSNYIQILERCWQDWKTEKVTL